MTSWDDHQAGLRAHDIANLRYHWGEAYHITWSAGRFRAERLDSLGCLEATTRAGLGRLIVDDYLKQPVPLGEPGRPAERAAAGGGGWTGAAGSGAAL
jgi:hypothetical protein